MLSLPAASQSRDKLPQPRVVTPGNDSSGPSDAVPLLNGKDLSNWTKRDGSPTGCELTGAEMVCRTGSGDAVSKQTFSDAQIHVVEGAGHGFSMPPPAWPDAEKAMFDFLEANGVIKQ